MEQHEVFCLGVSQKRRCRKMPPLLVSNLSNQWGLSQASAIQKSSSQDSLLRIKVQSKQKRQDSGWALWRLKGKLLSGKGGNGKADLPKPRQSHNVCSWYSCSEPMHPRSPWVNCDGQVPKANTTQDSANKPRWLLRTEKSWGEGVLWYFG